MISRRSFLSIGAGAVALGALSEHHPAVASAQNQSAGATGATVTTTAGKIRGLARNGIQIFKGVPYGASTTGTRRFMPPENVQPWTGVRDATEFGLARRNSCVR